MPALQQAMEMDAGLRNSALLLLPASGLEQKVLATQVVCSPLQ